MVVLIVTPEPPTDRAGNETTSARWRRLLEDLDHAVEVVYRYEDASSGSEFDAMIALHAFKSDPAIRAYREDHDDRPLVVALTGTDLYEYRGDRPEVKTNIDRADALVVLQEAALDELDEPAREKAHVVPQSLGRLEPLSDLRNAPDPADEPPSRCEGTFDVCVAAHLREVKAPLQTARAARRVVGESQLHVSHVGGALSEEWAERAGHESEANPRYDWLGEVPRRDALERIAESDLLVSTSRLEGGPNVVSEAVALGTPVLATEIPGHVGLLGPEYPGYVPPGDPDALADALERTETDPDFYRALVEGCRDRAPLFEPDRERARWREVLAALGG